MVPVHLPPTPSVANLEVMKCISQVGIRLSSEAWEILSICFWLFHSETIFSQSDVEGMSGLSLVLTQSLSFL